MLKLALLGISGTGKTQLAGELRAALSALNMHGVDIADNPPLPTAAENRQAFAFDLIFLMGLDLAPSQRPAPQNPNGPAREADDQELRHTLAQSRIPYTVVYGTGPARLNHALLALGAGAACTASKPARAGGATSSSTPTPWVWNCDSCSDPQCERRLLSDLLARRGG